VAAMPQPLTPWYPLYGSPIRKRKHVWQDQSSSKYYIFGINYSNVIDPEDLKKHSPALHIQRSFCPKSGNPDSIHKNVLYSNSLNALEE
jgi:hypothetical protein